MRTKFYTLFAEYMYLSVKWEGSEAANKKQSELLQFMFFDTAF